MHHIFLNIDPTYIGLSPYVPAIKRGLNLNSKDINLKISRGGKVYVLPLIAGFVGADTIGVILSSEIDKESELTLAIDVGTNGEIIVGNRDILTTASCAAGSALEGAHVKDGMRAAILLWHANRQLSLISAGVKTAFSESVGEFKYLFPF
ncbi:hypothetical protein ES708_26116 [subsurface metagenome]